MKHTVTGAPGSRRFVLVFDKGDDFEPTLLAFAAAQAVNAAHFYGIGAFQTSALAYFDRGVMEYLRIPVEEQVEVVSLIGNVTRMDGGRRVHAHATLGRRDGATLSGHLLEGKVWPTLEIMLQEMACEVRRAKDPETGLALIATLGPAAKEAHH